MTSRQSLRNAAREIWLAGVAAVDPARLLRAAVKCRQRCLVIGDLSLPLDGIERIVVVGAGKAGSAMSRAIEQTLGPRMLRDKQVAGCVNVPDDTVLPLRAIRLHPARAGHENQPTAAGIEGAIEIRRLVSQAGPRDLVLCLISGGGSALLPAPADGITLEDKQAVTGLLHACGATIHEMNAVRKHLSCIKGGGLVQGFRGRAMVSLIISDVVGDPLDVIASGPTAPDSSSFADALGVLDRYGLRDRVPRRVLDRLQAGAAGVHAETLKRLPRHVHNVVIGNNATALRAAERTARRLGFRCVNLGPFVTGESREFARAMAGLVRSIRAGRRPMAPPACLLSGGECTVTLGDHPGLGGRNQEWVLAMLHELGPAGMRGVVVLSGGTDGEDGPTDAAGAFADQAVVQAARRAGLDPRRFLNGHDAYHFFAPLGSLIRTGPTHTNVMDVRVVLVDA
jgi:hydroxypyruvate reductase/glycerate 2-kinase